MHFGALERPGTTLAWAWVAMFALQPSPASAQSLSGCAEGPAAYPMGESPCRSLSITSIAVHAVCTEGDHQIACHATLEAVFTSVSDVPVPLPMGELIRDPSSTITVDGAPWSPSDTLPMVAPGESRTARIETSVVGDEHTITQYTGTAGIDLAEMPPLRVRHFLVAEVGAGTRAQVARVILGWADFTRRSLGWRGVATPELDLEVPDGWNVHASFDVLGLSRSTADVVTNGGPVVSAGGTFDRGARVGVGYELGFAQGPTALVIGAHGELLFADQLRGVAALTVELASPGIGVLLPSFSAGIGLAVQVAPTAHAALRALATITWPFIGTSLLVDIYDAGNVDVSLVARVSL